MKSYTPEATLVLDLSGDKDIYEDSARLFFYKDFQIQVSTEKGKPVKLILTCDDVETDVCLVVCVKNVNPTKNIHFSKNVEFKSFAAIFIPYSPESVDSRLLNFDEITEESGFLVDSKMKIDVSLKKWDLGSYLEDDDYEEDYMIDDNFAQQFDLKLENFSDLQVYTSDDKNCGHFAFKVQVNKPENDEAIFGIDIIPSAYAKGDLLNCTMTILNVEEEMDSISRINYVKLSETPSIFMDSQYKWKDITEENGFLVNDTLSISLLISIDNDALYYQEIDASLFKPDTEEEATKETKETKSSKEETGFVGLKNQGMTCYMNSVLQSLYHIPAFRRIVYAMPITGSEDESSSIPLNLQRLFTKMQLSDTACSTTSLTKSFGWGDAETMMQHDVQEFLRVLLDNIETKLKGSTNEGAIAGIFRGKFRNFIRCMNVDYESFREEEFYDLQMLVKDMGDLQHSFEQYIETEKLIGDNQYQTDKFGKQDAEMGVEFIEFPKVLQIHLRRFEYDYDYDSLVKINDKFEFPETIDLTPYLAKSLDKKSPTLYELFGVLVHQGDATFGHYYCFLRPSTDPQWFEFNDSVVRRVSKAEAIDDNFGGKAATKSKSFWGSYDNMKSYSGYVLVYVKKDEEQSIFEPIHDESIPKHLKDYFAEAKEEKEVSAWSQTNVSLITEGDAKENCVHGKSCYHTRKMENCITAEKGEKASELYKQVSEYLKKDPETFRLWKVDYRTPTKIIPNDENAKSPQTYWLNLFVEEKKDKEFLSPTKDFVMATVKFFFANEKYPLQYVGNTFFDTKKPISQFSSYLKEQLKIKADVMFDYYFESASGEAIVLLPDSIPVDFGVGQGATIIAQFAEEFADTEHEFQMYEPQEEEKTEAFVGEVEEKITSYNDVFKSEIPKNIKQYLTYINEMIVITMHPLDSPKEVSCAVKFPSDAPFVKVKQLIATAAGEEFDPEKDAMLLYKCAWNTGLPSSTPINTTKSPGKVFNQYVVDACFIICKGVSEKDLVDMETYHVKYAPDGFAPTVDKRIIAKKGATVEEILRIMQDKGFIPKEGQFRAMEHVPTGTVYCIHKLEDNDMEENYTLRFDSVPEDQLKFDKKINKVVTCAHAYKDFYGNPIPYGDPFIIHAIKGEKFSDTKKRLKEFMKMNDSAFSHLRFFHYVYKGTNHPIEDTDELFDIYHFNDDLMVMGPMKTDKKEKEEGVKFYEKKSE